MDTEQGIKALGRLLRSARTDKEWTQKDVSEKTGLTPGYISNVEKGYVNPKRGPVVPSDDALRAFSTALDLPLGEMHTALGRFGNIPPDTARELSPEALQFAEAYDGADEGGRKLLESAADMVNRAMSRNSIGRNADDFGPRGFGEDD